ncbi:uncharacterized protein PAF06_019343 [Gastrophryne carolinensis]
MASKRHFSISKAVLDQISDSGSDTEPLAEMSDSDSWQDSSSDSDTDQRSGDSDNSAPDLSDVRTWCPIDCGMDEMTSLKRLSRRQIATTSSNPQLCFLGLILLTGVVGKPLQKWYWTTNKLLATPFFGTIMSECRFSLIMKNLHFTNNEEFDEATHPAPKLKKIWEVYQMILKNFQQSYVPDRDISIDESLMAYKGRLSWIQFIASKRARNRSCAEKDMPCDGSSALMLSNGSFDSVSKCYKGEKRGVCLDRDFNNSFKFSWAKNCAGIRWTSADEAQKVSKSNIDADHIQRQAETVVQYLQHCQAMDMEGNLPVTSTETGRVAAIVAHYQQKASAHWNKRELPNCGDAFVIFLELHKHCNGNDMYILKQTHTLLGADSLYIKTKQTMDSASRSLSLLTDFFLKG